MSLALRVACRYLLSREFATPEALKRYLQKHPKADPKKHTVRGKPKDEAKSKAESGGMEVLKGLSPEDRKRVLQRALEMEETKGESEKGPDVSKQDGFEALKGLSPAHQKRVIEKALKAE